MTDPENCKLWTGGGGGGENQIESFLTLQSGTWIHEMKDHDGVEENCQPCGAYVSRGCVLPLVLTALGLTVDYFTC